jgi:hypothetical protein
MPWNKTHDNELGRADREGRYSEGTKSKEASRFSSICECAGRLSFLFRTVREYAWNRDRRAYDGFKRELIDLHSGIARLRMKLHDCG